MAKQFIIPGLQKTITMGTLILLEIIKKENDMALICLKEGEAVPASVTWKTNLPKKGSKMKLLQPGEIVKWKMEGDAVKVSVPAALLKSKEDCPALAFSFTSVD